MDIFETLRIEHAAIADDLNDLIDKSTAPDQNPIGEDWPELFHDFKLSLVAHNRAEEAVFYQVLNSIPHQGNLANIKTQEHHLIEELLEDLEEINPADKSWTLKIALLKNQIDSHIGEEETTVFALVRPYITTEQSDNMVHEFESLRDEIVEGAPYHQKGRSIMNPAGLDLDS